MTRDLSQARRTDWPLARVNLMKAGIAFLAVIALFSVDFQTVGATEPTSSDHVFQLPDSLPQGSSILPLSVPFRSQLVAGDPYSNSNCGPAVLAMTFAYYGLPVSIGEARQDINAYMGIWNYDNGSSWLSLRWAAQIHGLQPYGLLDEDWLYEKWSLFDLLTESANGHPTILLVRYWELPGHEGASWWGDHYIVFLGLDEAGNVIYHDPAFHGELGASRTMSQEQLMSAWNNTSVGLVRTAMSLRGG